MKPKISIGVIFFISCFFSFSFHAKERWVLDKELSTINFELPIFLMKNVQGEFKQIEGLVEIDIDNKENNKAIFSVVINSIEMNYKNYKNLLLSNIFFNSNKFPIALIDTKKFTYIDENELEIIVILSIKGVTKEIPLKIEIIHLAKNLIQIKSKLKFSRTEFQIGKGKWASKAILKDNILIQTNLFLFKE